MKIPPLSNGRKFDWVSRVEGDGELALTTVRHGVVQNIPRKGNNFINFNFQTLFIFQD